MGKDVLQKGRISCRLPRHWRAGLVSKTRPVNGNGSEVRREPFLKRSHFSPSGDRTQGGKQKNDRSYSEAVIPNLNLLSLPTPSDAIRLRLHAVFLMLHASHHSSRPKSDISPCGAIVKRLCPCPISRRHSGNFWFRIGMIPTLVVCCAARMVLQRPALDRS